MEKREKAEQAKRERTEYYMYCGCCRKKKVKLNPAQKAVRKFAAWNKRVKDKKKDNNYRKTSKQGWQSEPEAYSTTKIEMPKFDT